MSIGKVMASGLAGIEGMALVSCAGGGGDDPTHGGVAPIPTSEMADRTGKCLETIGHGYRVFQRKCLECHVAMLPRDPHKAGWHAFAAGMAWNAGLTKSGEKVLLTYLDAVKD